jgi:hypothetical protein
MNKLVDIEALNLRSAPAIDPQNRLAILHLGQAVQVLGPAPVPDWLQVQVAIGNATKTGFLKGVIEGLPSLRDPAPAPREALVTEAIVQWLRFEKGLGQEHLTPFFRYVGEMWQSIGLDLDGKDRDQPWSAACISYIVRNVGAAVPKYRKFKFAPAHAAYMHDSIVKRKNGNTQAPFWGFRLHEKRPQIGDLVCRWRETPRDYDDAAAGSAFKSHSDIVVSVRPDHVLAIGGNVGQSVSITRYEKTGAGYLAPQDAVFMHMVNQT